MSMTHDYTVIVNSEQIEQLKSFDENGDFLIEVLRDGVTQIDDSLPEMEKYMNEFDVPKYKSKGHYLKGSTLTLGLPWLAGACSDANLFEELKTKDGSSTTDVDATKSMMQKQLDEIKHRRNETVKYIVNDLHYEGLRDLIHL